MTSRAKNASKKTRFERKDTNKKYKTDTLSERSIYVYLPSIGMAQKWKEFANKSGLSISKFVVEHVENCLNQEKDKEAFGSRVDLIRQVRELTKETAQLRRRNEMLDRAMAKLEDELKRYRAQPFLQDEFYGIREYEEGLIKLLKEKGSVRKDELLDLMGINPMSNGDVVKGINRQLENLERYGVIEDTGRVWQWKE